MINVDNNIIAKLFSEWLFQLLPDMVRPNQCRFVPGRSTLHNFRTIFAVLHSNVPDLPAAAIFLDANEVFDSLEWTYLFKLLHRIGLSPTFLKWIQLMYHKPTASIQVNGLVSGPFMISRGTRQGCPLSPILYAIAMEPLAA